MYLTYTCAVEYLGEADLDRSAFSVWQAFEQVMVCAEIHFCHQFFLFALDTGICVYYNKYKSDAMKACESNCSRSGNFF